MKIELYQLYAHDGLVWITLNSGIVHDTFDTDLVYCLNFYWWP